MSIPSKLMVPFLSKSYILQKTKRHPNLYDCEIEHETGYCKSEMDWYVGPDHLLNN